MADEATNVKESTEKKKGSPLLLIIGAVVLLGAGAGGGWFYTAKVKSKQGEKAKAEVEKVEVVRVVKLEPFLVNLGDPSGESFLRLGLDLGVSAAPSKGEGEAGGLTDSRVRDTILEILAKATSDSLLQPDGKAKLKEDILKALKEQVPKMGIQEIYFNDFLVQR